MNISKKKLDNIIKEAEGDWDFLLHLLQTYWKKETSDSKARMRRAIANLKAPRR